MNASELVDQLLDQTYTLPDALSRLRTLKDLVLLELFGHGDQPNQDKKPEISGNQMAWFSSLGKEFFDSFTRDNVYKLLEEMESEIKKITPLTLYLPIDLSSTGLTEIGQHIRKLFGRKFLIEIKYDPALIAGTALVWNGVYKDYSLKQKVAENRQKILETLKGDIKHQ